MKKLNELIEKAKNKVMSKKEREEQRISFAYGNSKIHNSKITRDMVKDAAKALKN
jgi:hypothetical protein